MEYCEMIWILREENKIKQNEKKIIHIKYESGGI